MTKEQAKTGIKLILILLSTVIVLFFGNYLIDKAFAEEETTYTIGNNNINLQLIGKDVILPDYNNITMNNGTIIVSGKIINSYQTEDNTGRSNYTFDKIVYETTSGGLKRIAAYKDGTAQASIMQSNNNLHRGQIYKYIIEFDNENDMNTFLNRKVYTEINNDVYGRDLFEKIIDFYNIEEYTPTENENEIFPNIEVAGGYIGVNYIGQAVNLENLIELTINYNRQNGTITYTLPANNTYTFYYIVISFMGGEEHLNINPYWWGLNFSTSNAVNNTIYAERTKGEIIEYTYQNDGYIPRTEQTNNNIYIRDIIYYTPTTNTARTTTLQFGSIQYINGYNTAIKYIEEIRQTAYNKGYSAGVETAQTGDFYHLISAVFSVPISVITGFANVTILGVNMLTVLRSILTLCIVAMIIKLVL